MSEELKLVVKRKHHLQKEDSGIVQILFTTDEADNIKQPDPTIFRTRRVWISSGYDEIEQRFNEEELFVLDYFREIDPYSPSQETVPLEGKAEHWANGKNAKKLNPNILIPVIKTELPDIGTGLFSFKGTIPAEQFFIISTGYVYGPFIASQSENETFAQPNQCLPLSLQQQHIAKVSIKDALDTDIYLTVSEDNWTSESGFITSIKDLASSLKGKVEQIDYINNSQLIGFFARNGFAASTKKLSRKHAEQLKSEITKTSVRNSKLSDNNRLSRLETILDKYLTEPEFGWPIIDEWLSSSAGIEFLSELIKKHPEIAASHTEDLNYEKNRLTDEISQLQADKRKSELEISAIKALVTEERVRSQHEIEQIRQQTKQQQQQERQLVMADLEDKIQKRQTDLDKLTSSISKSEDKMQKILSLEALKEDIVFNEKLLDRIKSGVREQEKLLRSPDFANELIKSDTILGLLQGRDFSTHQTIAAYEKPVISYESPINGDSVIQTIADEFEEGGRSFSFEEMANILITIQQSFMTVLKGLPGSGKTSTAIRLAQAYNIANQSGISANFLNIPVSRGWVSGRDFIGFFNALKGTYQPAKTGMYQFLIHGNEKSAQEILRLVLLDEANLSPIEHYMSDFLGLFDPEGSNRPIDTGMSDESYRFLNVPENIRFIATINNDNTTETLSPRLCDRVPIISMDYHAAQSIKSAAPFNMEGCIPYGVLDDFFGAKKEAETDFPTKIQLIIDLFQERNKDLGEIITISKRKRIAMHNYYEIAKQYMDDNTAVDFAVSQYMTPLINGFGKKFRARLERIKEQAQRTNLGKTEDILDNIIISGDAHVGNYSYF